MTIFQSNEMYHAIASDLIMLMLVHVLQWKGSSDKSWLHNWCLAYSQQLLLAQLAS